MISTCAVADWSQSGYGISKPTATTVVRAMLRLWLAVAKSDPDRAQAMVSDPSDVMRRLRRLLNGTG